MTTNPFARIAEIIASYRSGLKRTVRSWTPRLPAVYWGRHPSRVKGPAIILLPCSANLLCCGLAGIIAVKGRAKEQASIDLAALAKRVETIRGAGYRVIGHFTLPPSAWWDDYYLPLVKRLIDFRKIYRDDPQALAVVELHQKEIDIFRKYSDYYGYVFFVMQTM